ncbi:MAG: filamentous hemagglutinin N-terminal domain-containing protein [Synechococcaceae cyanobacterium RL_1_2]|nr:filamentous hemagglutinin N-terminal domain-containing protein [Synechococcaceae cyanobacterium RL_1_2]
MAIKLSLSPIAVMFQRDRVMLLSLGLMVGLPWPGVQAQLLLKPDSSLNTTVNSSLPSATSVSGVRSLIEGGTEIEQSLFHSFEEFNVKAGEEVYFNNPSGIDHILSRVTGTDDSDILGTLGVEGDADLYLINPNGIVFGPDAVLDIHGSFFAATTDELELGNGGVFNSTTDPTRSQLLNIDPNAIFQTALHNYQAEIKNKADLSLIGDGHELFLGATQIASPGVLSNPGGSITLEATPGDLFVKQLQAETAEMLSGQSINLNRSELKVAEELSLVAGETIALNGTAVKTKGDITFTAPTITITGNSEVSAQLDPTSSGTAQAGDLIFNSNNFKVLNSRISSSTTSNGDAGFVQIEATDQVILDRGATISTNVGQGAIGNAGEIIIETNELALTRNSVLSSSTDGQGNPGFVVIKANQGVTIAGANSGIFSNIEPNGVAINPAIDEGFDPGEILILTGTLNLSNGGRISATNLGQGQAGNVKIIADAINLYSKAIIEANTVGEGDAGAIQIHSLEVNGASLALGANGQSLFANNVEKLKTEFGSLTGVDFDNLLIPSTPLSLSQILANYSSIPIQLGYDYPELGALFTITNGQTLNLQGNSTIQSKVETGAIGEGGDIDLHVNTLNLSDRSSVNSSTQGQGNAGILNIHGQAINLDGSIFANNVQPGAIGNAGEIFVQTSTLNLANRSQITSSTSGVGNAGFIGIKADNTMVVDSQSGVATTINANGQAVVGANDGFTDGEILIATPHLILQRGGAIAASTEGQGNAGAITILTDNLQLLDGGAIQANVVGEGDGGFIQVSSLALTPHQVSTFSANLDQLKTQFQGNDAIDFSTVVIPTTPLTLSGICKITVQTY